jgi:hypothetical protein
MTEAERLVAEQLAHLINEDPDHNQSLRMAEKRGYEVGDEILRMKPEWLAGPAAAIVAKLRPLLFEEVAERMLHHAQAAEDHDATEGAVYTFMVAADQIREWAAALRTTTPEKEN